MGQHNTFCAIKGISTIAPRSSEYESSEYPVLIDTIVHDGTDWCIIYTDGWKEMGGYQEVSSISGYGTATVTFSDSIDGVSVSFTSAPVYVHCTPVYSSTTNSNFALYGVESVSSTGFTYRKAADNTTLSGFYWVAKGL